MSSSTSIYARIRYFIKERFDLLKEKDDEVATIEAIRRSVEFRGSNLWVLIFAIFVASLGLNTNSTAVIIGAMLISPLMGPIMGVGLGLGINDLELIKRAAKNLAIATLISLLTATVYFLISPLDEARSELLARTQPTIYDVLIAFFGGMAGIVANSTKEKGNVIPGVAIATALMPPLCTAGFGLATGQWNFFLGAFYLYFINSVFISLATYLGVRIMKFPKKQFIDATREKNVTRWITFIVVLTIAPSVWISFKMIRESYITVRANSFIQNELKFDGAQIISKEIKASVHPIEITVAYLGETIDQKMIDLARAKMKNYDLEDARLSISQGGANKTDIASLRSLVIEDFYKKTEQELEVKNKEIGQLVERLGRYESLNTSTLSLSKEVKVLFPTVHEIGLSNMVKYSTEKQNADTLIVACVSVKPMLSAAERTKLTEWLKTRTGVKTLELIVK